MFYFLSYHTIKIVLNYFFNIKIIKLIPLVNSISMFCSCITGSYDRTSRIWSTSSGSCQMCLDSHSDVVFDVAFVGDHEWEISAFYSSYFMIKFYLMKV